MVDSIIAFNGFELIVLLIGLVIANNLYELIISPLAYSFITLLIIFKIVTFVLDSSEMKSENHDLMTGKFFLKRLMMIIVMSLLAFPASVFLKTIKVTVNENRTVETGEISKFVPSAEKFEVEPSGYFSFRRTPEDIFGDSWFRFGNENVLYSEIFDGTPLYNSKFFDTLNGQPETFVVRLPLFIVFPIVLVDSLLYGNDGAPYKLPGGGVNEDAGVIPKIFGEYYNMVISRPGEIFHIIYRNSKIKMKSQKGSMYNKYIVYGNQVIDRTRFINKSLTEVLQIYNSFPYYFFLEAATGKENREGNWELNVNASQLKELIIRIDSYNTKLVSFADNNIGNVNEYIELVDDYLIENPTFSSDKIPVFEISNENFKVDPDDKRRGFPFWSDTSDFDLTNANMRGKLTFLNIKPYGGSKTDAADILLELDNSYVSLGRVRRSNRGTNSDIHIDPLFYFSEHAYYTDGTGAGQRNLFDDYSFRFNLYDNALRKLGIADVDDDRVFRNGMILAEENVFNYIMGDLKHMEKVIYPKNNSSSQDFRSELLTTKEQSEGNETSDSQTILSQLKEEANYSTISGSGLNTLSNKKKFLDYQIKAYFNSYFVSVNSINGFETFFNSPSVSSKLPTAYVMYDIYNEILTNFEENFESTMTGGSFFNHFSGFTSSRASDASSKTGVTSNQFINILNSHTQYLSNKINDTRDIYLNEHYDRLRGTAESIFFSKLSSVWGVRSLNNPNDVDEDDIIIESGSEDDAPSWKIPFLNVDVFRLITKFILFILGWLFNKILEGVLLCVIWVSSLLFSLMYSLHSFGILVALVTFPLHFIKCIFKESFGDLKKPFFDYLGYRMWDFSIMLVVTIAVLIVPLLIRFFYSIHSILATIMEIMLCIGIFSLTTYFIKMVRGVVGGGEGFADMFSKAGGGVSKVRTGGTRAGTALAGAGAIMAGKYAAKTGGAASKNIGVEALRKIKNSNVGGALVNGAQGALVSGARGVKGLVGGAIDKIENSKAVQGSKTAFNDFKNSKVGIQARNIAGKVKDSRIGQSVSSGIEKAALKGGDLYSGAKAKGKEVFENAKEGGKKVIRDVKNKGHNLKEKAKGGFDSFKRLATGKTTVDRLKSDIENKLSGSQVEEFKNLSNKGFKNLDANEQKQLDGIKSTLASNGRNDKLIDKLMGANDRVGVGMGLPSPKNMLLDGLKRYSAFSSLISTGNAKGIVDYFKSDKNSSKPKVDNTPSGANNDSSNSNNNGNINEARMQNAVRKGVSERLNGKSDTPSKESGKVKKTSSETTVKSGNTTIINNNNYNTDKKEVHDTSKPSSKSNFNLFDMVNEGMSNISKKIDK